MMCWRWRVPSGGKELEAEDELSHFLLLPLSHCQHFFAISQSSSVCTIKIRAAESDVAISVSAGEEAFFSGSSLRLRKSKASHVRALTTASFSPMPPVNVNTSTPLRVA